MDQPEMNQTKQTDETDSVAAPVGRVGGRRPSTLSIGDGTSGGAPETGPLGPGQRWSLARKRAVVLRLLRGEAPELVSREIGVPVYKLERWLEKAETALEDALKEREADTGGTELSAALQRIGELSMENELLRAKMGYTPGPLGRRRWR
jgi:hypothetical protein